MYLLKISTEIKLEKFMDMTSCSPWVGLLKFSLKGAQLAFHSSLVAVMLHLRHPGWRINLCSLPGGLPGGLPGAAAAPAAGRVAAPSALSIVTQISLALILFYIIKQFHQINPKWFVFVTHFSTAAISCFVSVFRFPAFPPPSASCPPDCSLLTVHAPWWSSLGSPTCLQLVHQQQQQQLHASPAPGIFALSRG